MKNSRATLFFRASASCSKILNDKKYIFNTVKNSRVTLFFRASASRSKILNAKSILNINTVKNSRATLFFKARASCSKILNLKSIFHTVKIFRASASCSKLLNVKSVFNPVKNFWGKGNSVFRVSASCYKSWIWKVYSLQWKFSGQAQVAQKSWTVKTFSKWCIFTWGRSV